MTVNVHARIKALIEDTNDAFACYGHVNTDYAEFATLAISDFKAILSNPALTSSQLKQLLRTSMLECRDFRCKDQDPDNWAALMAQHIARAINQN